MKFLVLVVIAAVYSSSVTAEDDGLEIAAAKCEEKMNLAEDGNLDEKQTNCFLGCLLQELKMINADGKLRENGIEALFENLSTEYQTMFPNLRNDLTQLKPKLLRAKDACEAGKIILPVLRSLFDETE